MSQQQCLPLPPQRRKRPNRDGETKNKNENDDKDPTIGVGTTIDSLEHMDALEYLASVHSQARSLPDVFVSKKTRGKMKGASPGNGPSLDPKDEAPDAPLLAKQRPPPPIEGSAASLSCLLSPRLSIHPPPTPRHLPPNPRRWTDDTLANFSELRSYMESCALNGVGGKDSGRRVDVPPMKDRTGWHEFCLGEDEAGGNVGGYFDDCDGGDDEGSGTAEEEEFRPEWKISIPPEGNVPRVELLLQMDQVMVRRVLSHHVHYLTDGLYALTPSRSKWLYGLLAVLQKPLHREEASLLRELLRELTRRRSEICFDGQKSGTADKESLVARINVLVVVSGLYFEQGGGYNEVMSVAS